MNKDRIISELQKITQKIQRNKQQGYSTENLELALDRLIEKAKEKNIKIWKGIV